MTMSNLDPPPHSEQAATDPTACTRGEPTAQQQQTDSQQGVPVHGLQGPPAQQEQQPTQQQVLVSSGTSCSIPASQTDARANADPDDVVMGVPVDEYAQQWQAMAVQQQAVMAWYGQAWLAQMHQGSSAQGSAAMPLQGMGMVAHHQVSQMYQQLMSSQQQMAVAIEQHHHSQQPSPQMPPPSHPPLPLLELQPTTHQLLHGSSCSRDPPRGASSFGAAFPAGPGLPPLAPFSPIPPASMPANIPPLNSSSISIGGPEGWGTLPVSCPFHLPQSHIHPASPLDMGLCSVPSAPWPPPPPPLDLSIPPDSDHHLSDPYQAFHNPAEQQQFYGAMGGEGMGMLGQCGMLDVVDATEEGEEDLEEGDPAGGELGVAHSCGVSPASSSQRPQRPLQFSDREEGGSAAEEAGRKRRRHQSSTGVGADASAAAKDGAGTWSGAGRRGERKAAAVAPLFEGGQLPAQSSSGGVGGGGLRVKTEDGSVQQPPQEGRARPVGGSSAPAGRTSGATASSARATPGDVRTGSSGMSLKAGLLMASGVVAASAADGHGEGGGHGKRELSAPLLDPNAAKRGRRTTKDSKVCKNCGTQSTPFWRKDKADGKPLCNACGLYFSKNESHRPKMLWKEDERLGLGSASGSPRAQASSGHAPAQHQHQPGVPASSKGGPSGGPGPSSSTPRPGVLKMPPSAYLVGLPPMPPALANFLAAAVAASGAVPGSPAAHAAAAAAASAITKMPAAGGGGGGAGAGPTPPGGNAAAPGSASAPGGRRQTPPLPAAMPPAPPALGPNRRPPAPPPVAMPPAQAPLAAPARLSRPPAPPPAIAMPPAPPPVAMLPALAPLAAPARLSQPPAPPPAIAMPPAPPPRHAPPPPPPPPPAASASPPPGAGSAKQTLDAYQQVGQ